MNDEEKTIRDLLQSAGPRPAMTAEDEAIRHAARGVWQVRYARKSRRTLWLALAAASIAGLTLAWWIATRDSEPRPPLVAAHVEKSSGVGSLSPGEALLAGAIVDTEDGRAALRMPGLQSVRLDVGTSIRLLAPALVQLDRGAVYVDSEHRGRVVIRTSAGDVSPAGTQFEVRVDGSRLRVRVREGNVTIASRLAAAAGDEIRVDRGQVTRGRIAAADPAWDWTQAVSPVPEIEGRSVRIFLDWIAREKGWRLRFASPKAESLCNATIMHGSVRELTPADALSTVMMSAGMEYRAEGGELIVFGVR